MNTSDKRCCGSGVCIINNENECWCGQFWDGEKMVPPGLTLPIQNYQQDMDSENFKLTLKTSS